MARQSYNVGMMNIKRMLVWLGRIHRCRGFGVQSPWAYRMVRYVISEHYPYYAYADLRAAYPGVDAVTRRLCELCLRLANSVRPGRAVLSGVDGTLFGAYINAGCRSTVCMTSVNEYCELNPSGRVFAVLAPQKGLREVLSGVSATAEDGSVVLIIGIHGDRAVRRLWREVVSDMPGVTTFDLYYCGLVFFDGKRYKQNYIINF